MLQHLRSLVSFSRPARRAARPLRARLTLETLEDRAVPATTTLSSQDQQFLTSSVQGDQQEMTLGSLAYTVGDDRGVQGYGLTLLTDHARMFSAAMPLLSLAKESLPAVSPDMLEHIERVASDRGEVFDKAFASYMVQDHTNDVKDFQDEINKGSNPQVVAYARQWLPTIEKHLHMAQTLAAHGGDGDASDPSEGSPSPRATHRPASTTLSTQDVKFLTSAMQGDQQEMILGALAYTVGQSSGARAYGRTLLMDHARLFSETMPLFHLTHETLPPLSPDMRQHVQAVASKQGQSFDGAFVNYMVEDHTNDVTDFQDEIHKGSNKYVVNVAQRFLPTIEKHLHIAQSLQKQEGS